MILESGVEKNYKFFFATDISLYFLDTIIMHEHLNGLRRNWESEIYFER